MVAGVYGSVWGGEGEWRRRRLVGGCASCSVCSSSWLRRSVIFRFAGIVKCSLP